MPTGLAERPGAGSDMGRDRYGSLRDARSGLSATARSHRDRCLRTPGLVPYQRVPCLGGKGLPGEGADHR